MRIVFSLVLLAGAIFYSYIAFADLSFLSRTGRLGPGFFPRIIGLTSVVMMLWIVIEEVRRKAPASGNPQQWREVVLLVALALGYAVLLRLFGGFIATVIFLAAALSLINRGKALTNAAVAVLVPVFVYLLFDRVLNASMPPALIDLPI